jgi:two-component system copper resistance phosphate regulon response regulator CusR
VRILVIEDDPTVGQYVKRGLEEQRWSVDLVADGEEGERHADSEAYDLVILDMRLPGKPGLDVLRSLRSKGFERPVLVLTAQDAVDAKVTALRAGADDYVTKPFAFEELLARVHARLRHRREPDRSTLRIGELVLDLRGRRAARNGVTADLTAKEFMLLETLMEHAGQVLSREQLLSHVWGYDYDPGVGSNVVEVYVRYLRRKLGADVIETVRGMGYCLRR